MGSFLGYRGMSRSFGPRSAALRAVFLAALVGLATVVPSGAEFDFEPLYFIDTQIEGEVSEEPPRVKLRLGSPDRAIHRGDSARVEDGWLVVDMTREAPAVDEPTDAHLAATFLVDHDEAPVLGLLDSDGTGKIGDGKIGDGESSVAQRIEALVALTDQSVPIKSGKRGWDAASVVATRGEGDCTEHAVLLAALARGQGLPARVVIGTLVEVVGEQAAAYGHAWTEIYDGEVWRRADAAQYLDPESAAKAEEMGQRLYYVPLALVESEGLGYGLQLFDTVSRAHPDVVIVAWGE